MEHEKKYMNIITNTQHILWQNVLSNQEMADSAIDTHNVMREETELILNKQRTIFNILSVATVITIIITFNI